MRLIPSRLLHLLWVFIAFSGHANEKTPDKPELLIQASDSPQMRICLNQATNCILDINTEIPLGSTLKVKPIDFHIEILKSANQKKDVEAQKKQRLPQRFFRIGNVGYKQQCFYDESTQLWILHYLCDHPGELHVSVGSPSTERRIDSDWLIIPDPLGRSGLAAKLLPFESSLEANDRTLSTHGEGELLIIIAQTSMPAASNELSGRWHKLLLQHEEKNVEHPNLHAFSVKLAESLLR